MASTKKGTERLFLKRSIHSSIKRDCEAPCDIGREHNPAQPQRAGSRRSLQLSRQSRVPQI